MAKGPPTRCPQCGRVVGTYYNKFKDLVYRHHKMASAFDAEARKEWEGRPNINWSVAPIWDITCPMSGQVVD